MLSCKFVNVLFFHKQHIVTLLEFLWHARRFARWYLNFLAMFRYNTTQPMMKKGCIRVLKVYHLFFIPRKYLWRMRRKQGLNILREFMNLICWKKINYLYIKYNVLIWGFADNCKSTRYDASRKECSMFQTFDICKLHSNFRVIGTKCNELTNHNANGNCSQSGQDIIVIISAIRLYSRCRRFF